jgi:ribonuclease HI
MKEIIAYTDGSAVVRGKMAGAGGFATYFPDLFGRRVAYSLGFKNTKTGRAELIALIYAIKAMPLSYKERVQLTVYSDSEYVVKSFTEKRLEKWIRNNWTNTSGDVKNQDLWKAVLSALNKRTYLRLNMIHIKGHQVDKEKNPVAKAYLLQDPHIVGNMIADKLADYKRHKTLLKSDKLWE